MKRLRVRRHAAAALAALTLAAGCAYHTLPLTEPAAKVEPAASIPEPGKREVGAWWAFTEASFFYPAKRFFDLPLRLRRALGLEQRALDIDAFGEVPDSNWFVNRNTRRALSPEEIERGPGEPPAPGPWRVVAGKQGGIQPGFTIEDAAGRRYIMKLDVADYPEMATSAEVISDHLYWAAGYYVPGASIVYFGRQQLTLDPRATYVTKDGFTRPLTPEALEGILCEAPRTRQGQWRAAAVNYVEGRLKGPFSYLGTRPDDPNDTIPHQHRRELRALLVISSFLNNIDMIQTNTLDSYVTEGGKSYLKHHLIDFGTSLGSYAFIHMPRRAGHEHAVDWGAIGRRLVSLGAYSPAWEGAQMDISAATGYLDLGRFEPARWRPEYPNPTFDHLTAEDGFWGARVVMSFTDEQIRAAVRAARLSDPQAEGYLVRSLRLRRDEVGRYWFAQVSPLTSFELRGPAGGETLTFRDLAADCGLADPAETAYELSLPGHEAALTRQPSLDLNSLAGLPESGRFALEVSALREGRRLPPVRVRLERDAAGCHLLGLEHEAP